MDHSRPMQGRAPAASASNVAPPFRDPVSAARLAVVTSRLRLAEPGDAAPEAWRVERDALLAFAGVDAEFVSPAPARRLPRMGDWARGAAAPAPVFAPWLGWSPAAFQHGGAPSLPAADFVASYLIEHARGAAPGQGGTDIVLLSPHPATCTSDDVAIPPLPRAGVLRAMIRAAAAEGRERLAIIVHQRQRNALARQMLAAGKALMQDGPELDILTIEDALPVLMQSARAWDAIIAMPDLRSIVFALLGLGAGVHGAWPLLWFAGARHGTHPPRLTLVTSEVAGEGVARLTLDAPALVHGLALTLHEAGAHRAAGRLHEAWSRLRDSGVSTTTRGHDAPYGRTLPDAEFLALLRREPPVSQRPQTPWRALKCDKVTLAGSQSTGLRVVASNPQIPSPKKGR